MLYEELLSIKKWHFLVVLIIFQLVILFVIKYFFATEYVFYNTYADQFTFDRIKIAFESQSKYQWLGYLFLPLVFIIKVLYNTILLTTGSLLNTENGYFKSNFNICLKAEYIFVAMLLVKLASFAFFKEVNTLNDLGFIPGSLLNLFNTDEVPKWAVYPLQTINVWEVWFCWVGTSLYAIQFGISKSKAAVLFCVPYLIGLFIWMLIVVFLTMQFT